MAFGPVPQARAGAASVGGDVAVTSASIARGLSETYDHGAVQLDLHVNGTRKGLFAGVFGSTRDPEIAPAANYDLDLYAGRRFELSSSWNATLTLTDYLYVGGRQEVSNDYQELAASLSYLDRWTFTLAVDPNAVRYRREYRLGRYAAYVAETSGQWIIADGLFVTGGTGYYYVSSSGRLGASYSSLLSRHPGARLPPMGGAGYLYGNVGLAFERRQWRVEIGYFFTQHRARAIFPYPSADGRFAGTVSWQF